MEVLSNLNLTLLKSRLHFTLEPLPRCDPDIIEREVADYNIMCVCVITGWGYEVDRPLRTKTRPKSYAANFSWDKNTRIVTK